MRRSYSNKMTAGILKILRPRIVYAHRPAGALCSLPPGGGCEVGDSQPNAPAPRYVPAMPESPPKKNESGQKQALGEQISPERTKSPVKPADDPVQASRSATPAQISSTAKRLDGVPESFANVASIVERSAMPEQDRRGTHTHTRTHA